MDITQLALFGSIVIGVVELITRLRARDLWTVATIVSAGLAGALLGLTGYFTGIDWVLGLVYGLGASGAVKIAYSFGGNASSAEPSKIIVDKDGNS